MSALSAYFSEGCEFKFVLCAPFSYLDDHVTIRGIFDRKKNIFPNLLSFLKEQKQGYEITTLPVCVCVCVPLYNPLNQQTDFHAICYECYVGVDGKIIS